tara:strand:- start:269 stop:1075 length:807 start_codon:yes stop_codon:yes gene_type:complete
MFDLEPFTPDEIGPQSGLSSHEQEEIIKTIIAAIWADGKIHKSEQEYLNQIKEVFMDHPPIVKSLKKFIHLRHPIVLKPIKIPAALSIKVFKTVVSICSCDLDLDINEIYLMRETAVMLNIDIELRRQIINELTISMKSKLLDRLLQDMEEDEIFTLVVVTLEIVYNDNELVDKDIPYLEDLVRITKEHNLIERISIHGEQIEQKSIDPIKAEKFVKFMLEISMSDGIWFPYELKMIRKIGSELQIVEEKVEWLIFSVHASYKILLEI